MHKSYAVHWTQEYDQDEGLHEDLAELLHCYVESYTVYLQQIIATPKFTEFDEEVENSDLKILKKIKMSPTCNK